MIGFTVGIAIYSAVKNGLDFFTFFPLFLAYIRIGAQNMGRYSDVSHQLVKIIQGIIILFFAAEGLFKSEPFRAFLRKNRGSPDV